MRNRYWKIQVRRARELAKNNSYALMNKIFSFSSRNELFLDFRHIKNTYPTSEYCLANSYYGIARSVEEYAGCNAPIASFFEHGLHLGGNNPVTRSSVLPSITTFGSRRYGAIRSDTDKPIFEIGPYILYAKSFLDAEERKRIKECLGRVLLVFPAHGIEGITVEYDTSCLIQNIREIAEANDINTVMVSLYFKDVPRFANLYKGAGMMVVCSGHRGDPLFLSRQRTFIELSDLTLSNSVGTHVGYCAALGKPHCILSQNTEYILDEENRVNAIPNHSTMAFKNDEAKITSAFSSLNLSGTGEQNKVLEHYWGMGKTLSAQSLKGIIDASRYALIQCRHRSNPFSDFYIEYVEQNNDVELRNIVMEALR